MTATPRDLSDLYLAPIVLSVDARIEELGKLSPEGLILAVEMVTDHPIMYQTLREEALMSALVALDEPHGWTSAWDARGLRLTHGEHSVVLGIPPTFTDYLNTPRHI